MLCKKNACKRRAFTLFEVALVFGIMGLVLSAIWSAASASRQRSHISKAVDEANIISVGLINVMQGKPFPALSTDITSNVIALGIVPSWAVVSTSLIASPWNTSSNSVNVYTAADAKNAPMHFRVIFNKTPKYACIGLLTQATQCKSANPGCPVSVLANGSTQAPDSTTDWQVLDMSAANSLCNASGTSNVVTLEYSL